LSEREGEGREPLWSGRASSAYKSEFSDAPNDVDNELEKPSNCGYATHIDK